MRAIATTLTIRDEQEKELLLKMKKKRVIVVDEEEKELLLKIKKKRVATTTTIVSKGWTRKGTTTKDEEKENYDWG